MRLRMSFAPMSIRLTLDRAISSISLFMGIGLAAPLALSPADYGAMTMTVDPSAFAPSIKVLRASVSLSALPPVIDVSEDVCANPTWGAAMNSTASRNPANRNTFKMGFIYPSAAGLSSFQTAALNLSIAQSKQKRPFRIVNSLHNSACAP